MKKIIFYSSTILWLLLALITGSCDDSWDDHYKNPSQNLPKGSVMELIESKPELSIFAQMLKNSGYSEKIQASQTYTVWAPINEALEGIDMQDERLVKEIVVNHIARGLITTSGVDTRRVNMENGKFLHFSRLQADDFTIGGIPLLEANELANNGLLHKISGFVPYTLNLWEYIGRAEGLEEIKNFLYSYDEMLFDAPNSVVIAYNEDEQPIYDSVFIYGNRVLEKIGYINRENMLYTALLPDNDAWNEAYDRIKPYFNIPNIFGGEERADFLAKYTLVKDLFYPGLIESPAGMPYLATTTGNVLYNTPKIFANTQKNELSNAYSFKTSGIEIPDTASWFKTIKIEAESTTGRKASNSRINIRNSYGSEMNISQSEYISVDPISLSAQPSVTFQIPNTLSASYDIYCVFVPEVMINPNNPKPNRADFTLVSINTTAGRIRRNRITPADNVTDPYEVTKMYLGRFDFEFANVVDEEYDLVPVELEIANSVTAVEINDFSRRMLIDYILLEPVME